MFHLQDQARDVFTLIQGLTPTLGCHPVPYSAVSWLEARGWRGYPEAQECLLLAIFTQPPVFICMISMPESAVVCVCETAVETQLCHSACLLGLP